MDDVSMSAFLFAFIFMWRFFSLRYPGCIEKRFFDVKWHKVFALGILANLVLALSTFIYLNLVKGLIFNLKWYQILVVLLSLLTTIVAVAVQLYFQVLPRPQEQAGELGDTTDMQEFKRHRSDLLKLILLTPLVFVVIAFRAQNRILSVISGHAFNNDSLKGLTHEDIMSLELASYDAILELATFVQYVSVIAFVDFCRRCVHLQINEIRRQMQGQGTEGQAQVEARWGEYFVVNIPFTRIEFPFEFGGLDFLGTCLYIILGMLRSLATFVSIVIPNFTNEYWDLQVSEWFKPILARLDSWCFLSTLVVFVCSQIMLRRKGVEQQMSNAGKRFEGTRYLLLAPIQLAMLKNIPAFVHRITQATAFFGIGDFGFEYDADLHASQARLYHAALLSFESLVVIILNYRQWENEIAQARMGYLPIRADP